MCQSCKSGRAVRIRAGFGSKVDKIWGLIRALRLFAYGAQKYNQNNLATLLNDDFIFFFSEESTRTPKNTQSESPCLSDFLIIA